MLARRALPTRALLSEAALGALEALRVGGVAQRVHRRLQQRPAQVGGPCLESGPRQSFSPEWFTRGQSPV
jgi:hypothetical protein